MAVGNVIAHPGEPRVSTGNASLDGMLEGGLVARRPYLIVGPSGTGKTTLAIQFLCEGVRRGERVLLVTLEEPPNEARINHRGLEPELNSVDVFDAIPDIMRYERAPFKDISAVRSAVPFRDVPWRIRRSPELASVEVTITALEQMLRTEVIRKGYTRLVVDSLTALQYFCMKGFDPVAGAQSFLRFLSDLHVTTLLTVEAPLEDVETPERMLARGEIRLFRWELDGQTVRAIGVEKFRGSSHDVRLHPYRIGPQGIDINLDVTISRDTRQIIEPLVPHLRPPATVAPTPPLISPVTPLVDEVRDLILLGADVEPARTEIEAALVASNAGRPDEVRAHLSRVSSLLVGLVDQLSHAPRPAGPEDHGSTAAFQRVLARVDSVRTGVPPTSLPPQSVLQVQLGALLSLMPPGASPTPAEVPSAPSPLSPAAEAPATVSGVSPTPPATAEPSAIPEPLPEVAEHPSAETPSVVVEPAPPPMRVEPPVAASSSAPATAVEPTSTPVAPMTTEARAGRSSRPASAKGLAPPPKPRASVTGARPPKPAPAPSAGAPSHPAEPPPLPTGAPPEWKPPEVPPPMPAPPLAPHPAPGAPAVPPSPTSVLSAPASAKRRRRVAPATPGKKTAAHPRASPPHTAPEASAPPAHPAPAHPTVVPPLEVAPLPAVATPLPQAPPEAAPRVRRRTPRKRKAPPVVSATVEPIPPGVFGAPDVETPPPDPPSENPSPPED